MGHSRFFMMLGSYNGSVYKIFILVMAGSTPPPSTNFKKYKR